MQWVFGVFLKSLFDWFLDKFQKFIKSREEMKQEHKENADQAAQDMKPVEDLKPGDSKEKVDAAIDSALDHL